MVKGKDTRGLEKFQCEHVATAVKWLWILIWLYHLAGVCDSRQASLSIPDVIILTGKIIRVQAHKLLYGLDGLMRMKNLQECWFYLTIRGYSCFGNRNCMSLVGTELFSNSGNKFLSRAPRRAAVLHLLTCVLSPLFQGSLYTHEDTGQFQLLLEAFPDPAWLSSTLSSATTLTLMLWFHLFAPEIT